MKKSLLVLLGLFNILVCRAQSDSVILNDQKTINELISIFQILPNTATRTELTKEELKLVKELTKKYIEDYNVQIIEDFKNRGVRKKYAEMYQIKDLLNYKIQYVPYLNEKGEKEIWINGFCHDFNHDWKNEIIYVFDGGNCYFKIKLNLSTGKCLEIGTNGYA